ncbi:MAG TPA: hypothetical protein VKA98_02555 [Nitrososphaeraceae archaeon]|nr:hypothetical protein [Nitrososphaeraceae archaeon]
MHYTSIIFRSINKESITALISLIKRNHVSFGIGFNHKPEKKLHRKRKRIYEFLADDETLIKVGNELV